MYGGLHLNDSKVSVKCFNNQTNIPLNWSGTMTGLKLSLKKAAKVQNYEAGQEHFKKLQEGPARTIY